MRRKTKLNTTETDTDTDRDRDRQRSRGRDRHRQRVRATERFGTHLEIYILPFIMTFYRDMLPKGLYKTRLQQKCSSKQGLIPWHHLSNKLFVVYH